MIWIYMLAAIYYQVLRLGVKTCTSYTCSIMYLKSLLQRLTPELKLLAGFQSIYLCCKFLHVGSTTYYAWKHESDHSSTTNKYALRIDRYLVCEAICRLFRRALGLGSVVPPMLPKSVRAQASDMFDPNCSGPGRSTWQS